MHRTLKEEFNLERGFPTGRHSAFELAQQAVERTIHIYNRAADRNKYPHGSLGYLTPNQVHNGKKPGKKNRTADAVEPGRRAKISQKNKSR